MLPTAGACDGEAGLRLGSGARRPEKDLFLSFASFTAFHGPLDGCEVALGVDHIRHPIAKCQRRTGPPMPLCVLVEEE